MWYNLLKEIEMIEQIIKDNQDFVASRKYIEFATDKFPDKNIAILTCMDTRLTQLLPNALNLKNGDAKIIKNAGALITHPYGSVMRSLIIAIHELQVKDILVIGHYACGMHNLSYDSMVSQIKKSGIEQSVIDQVATEIDLESWLTGFEDSELQIKESINIIKQHPLVPKSINVYGFLIDPTTGELTPVATDN